MTNPSVRGTGLQVEAFLELKEGSDAFTLSTVAGAVAERETTKRPLRRLAANASSKFYESSRQLSVWRRDRGARRGTSS